MNPGHDDDGDDNGDDDDDDLPAAGQARLFLKSVASVCFCAWAPAHPTDAAAGYSSFYRRFSLVASIPTPNLRADVGHHFIL